MNREKNITRMDYARNRGWWVRIYRSTAGKKCVHSKLFSDRLHGGKRKALSMAVAWRDEMLKRLPAAQKNSGRRVLTGHGYVRRTLRQQRVDKHPVFMAVVRYPDGWRQTTYSIGHHGVQGARELAEAWLAKEQRALRKRTANASKRAV